MIEHVFESTRERSGLKIDGTAGVSGHRRFREET